MTLNSYHDGLGVHLGGEKCDGTDSIMVAEEMMFSWAHE